MSGLSVRVICTARVNEVLRVSGRCPNQRSSLAETHRQQPLESDMPIFQNEMDQAG